MHQCSACVAFAGFLQNPVNYVTCKELTKFNSLKKTGNLKDKDTIFQKNESRK